MALRGPKRHYTLLVMEEEEKEAAIFLVIKIKEVGTHSFEVWIISNCVILPRVEGSVIDLSTIGQLFVRSF